MKKKIIAILICLNLAVTILPYTAFAGSELLSVKTSGDNVIATYSGTTSLSNIIFLAEFDKNGNLKNIKAKKAAKNATLSLPYKAGSTYKTFALKKNSAAPVSETADYNGVDYNGTIEPPVISGSVANSTTLAVREYAKARILVDELLALDIDEVYGNPEKFGEYMQKINDAKAAYDNVLKSAAVLDRASSHSAAAAEAELLSMQQQDVSLFATEEEQLHWAEQITKQYDSIKGTKKLGELGKMLGCDAKEAYEQLTAAQDILRGKYMSDAKTADNWVKGLTVVKTGCKVSLFVGATIATAGAGGATLTGATGLLLSGADATIDVGRTTAVVAFGDDSKIVSNYEKTFAPITTASTIFSICTLGSASPGEVIACLGDLKQTIEEKTGFSLDTVSFNINNEGKVEVKILSTKLTEDDFKRLLNDPAFIGDDRYETLKNATDLFEENREGDTKDKLEEVLKEEELIEDNETLDDFKDEIKEFDKESKEELAKKKSEEEDETGGGGGTSTVTYREEYSGNHLLKYYTNKNGDYIGLYEDFIYDYTKSDYVLVHQEMYDDDGKIQSITWYDTETGKPSSTDLFTDGYNIGSVRTSIRYYTSEDNVEIPDDVAEPVKMSWQEIFVPYIDDDGEESTTTKYYFGDYYYYSPTGVLWEHSTGTEGTWDRMEVFDDSGTKTLEYINNYDGTYTRNGYFTKKPIGCKFNPTGHLQFSQVWTDGEGDLNGVPSANTSNIVSAEEWMCESNGYMHVYGLVNHQTDGDYKYSSPYTGLYYSDGGFIKMVDDE